VDSYFETICYFFSKREISRTGGLNEFDDLFVNVQAVALTTEEALAVEGDGFLSALGGFITGFISGVVQWGAVIAFDGTNGATGQQLASNMFTSALISGFVGGIGGLFSPLP
jgi:hypothetical protein